MKFRLSVGNIVRLLVLCVSIIVFASSSLAQITFNDFSNISNLQFNGVAAQSNQQVLRLTTIGPGVQGQAGSAWFKTPQPIAGGFTSTFTFQLTPGQPIPADGIAFVIQNAPSPLAALGGTGGAMGYGQGTDSSGAVVNGLQNSLAIEFDSYTNGWDPDANHVAVQNCGYNYQQLGSPNVPPGSNNEFHQNVDANFNPAFEGAAAFTSCTLPNGAGKALVSLFPPNPAITLADGAPHTVTVDYEACASGQECSPRLHVSIDNQDLFPGGIFLDLASQLQLGSGGTAYVGFTGGTGSYTENGDILSWMFTPHSVTITKPTPPGQTTVFPFGAFNFKSTPANTTQNGNVLSVTATSIPAGTLVNFSGGSAKCIPYANAGNTCWDFSLVCTGPDCGGSYDAEFSTSYDVQLGTTISRPGLGKYHNPGSDTCTLSGNALVGTFANQIDAFFVTRIDPTTKGTSGGTPSCWVATQDTPGITSTVSNFIGFNAPVSNTKVNPVKAGQAVPLSFSILTQGGAPVTNLTLCTAANTASCLPGSVAIQDYPSSCSVDGDTSFGPEVPADAPGNSGLQNLGGGNYQFNWKTTKGWTGCRTIQVNLLDGINHIAVFQFK